MIAPSGQRVPPATGKPMDYYVRAFCLSDRAPTPGTMLTWLEERGVRMIPAGADDKSALEDPNWRCIHLLFATDKPPFVLDCHRNTAEDSEAHRQIQSFLERIGPAGKSSIKRRVIAHLKGTKFLAAMGLPVDDMDDAAWDANGQILTFFAEQSQALLQADREGFYERSNLILKLP